MTLWSRVIPTMSRVFAASNVVTCGHSSCGTSSPFSILLFDLFLQICHNKNNSQEYTTFYGWIALMMGVFCLQMRYNCSHAATSSHGPL